MTTRIHVLVMSTLNLLSDEALSSTAKSTTKEITTLITIGDYGIEILIE